MVGNSYLYQWLTAYRSLVALSTLDRLVNLDVPSTELTICIVRSVQSLQELTIRCSVGINSVHYLLVVEGQAPLLSICRSYSNQLVFYALLNVCFLNQTNCYVVVQVNTISVRVEDAQ